MNVGSPAVVRTFMIIKKWNKCGVALIRLVQALVVLGAVTWPAAGDEVELRAGDIIQLRLLGVPDVDRESISGNYTVAGEGTLRLPYLKRRSLPSGRVPLCWPRKSKSSTPTPASILNQRW